MTHRSQSTASGATGWLSASPVEVRLAVTLFLVLMGLANIFGFWQVRDFAAFSPKGIAETVSPGGPESAVSDDGTATEVAVNLDQLNSPPHHIERDLLVQDSHVHIPAYALTAAALSLIVLGLQLSSTMRSTLIAFAFAAPFADFGGLWGAHLAPGYGTAFGALAMIGGFGMGIAYTAIAAIALVQCWWPRRLGGSS